jgi:thioredoxin-like negative regulator of GroEL
MKAVAAMLLLAMLASCASAKSVITLTADNFQKVTHNSEHAVLVLFYTTWTHKHENARDVMTTAAEEGMGRDDIIVAEFDATDAAHHDIARKHAIDSFPAVVLFIYDHDERRYGYPTINSADIKTFAADLTDEHQLWKATAHEESLEQAKPVEKNHPHPNPGKVAEFTTDDFRKYSGDHAKTVVVLFFSPSCDACKEYMPIFDALAQYFAGDPKTVIAKMDGDAHRDIADEIRIERYPTVRAFPKGSHAKLRGLDYKGERELHAMQDWADLHNSNLPIEGRDDPHPFPQHDDPEVEASHFKKDLGAAVDPTRPDHESD